MATCSSCVMASRSWPREARDPGPFDARLKCCTYLPFLPNFTIGRLIKAGGHEGRLADAAKLGHLTPLGLIPRDGSSEHRNFGKDESRKCPFLGDGCTIWSERPSVCRSYFCISNEGAAGQATWKDAEAHGNELEWTLANQVLWEMGFTDDEIASKSWMEWKGRESEFFVRCAEISEALDPIEKSP